MDGYDFARLIKLIGYTVAGGSAGLIIMFMYLIWNNSFTYNSLIKLLYTAYH